MEDDGNADASGFSSEEEVVVEAGSCDDDDGGAPFRDCAAIVLVMIVC